MSTGFQSRLLNDFDGFKTLGRGGYGLVVSAKHVLDRNEYAIKGIRVKKEKIERVLKEVHAMAKIDHTGFVRYHTSWAEEPPPEFQKSYQTRIEKLIKKGNVANEEHSNLSKPHKFAETIGNSSQGPSGPQRIHKSKSYPLVKNTMTFPQREDSDLTDSESEEGPPEEESSDGGIVFVDSNGERNEVDDLDIDEDEAEQEPTVDVKCYLYIQMQYCREGTLAKWLKTHRQLASRSIENMWNWFRQLLQAIKYLHSINLIHRDIKPLNIFLANQNQLKIGDMGLVCEGTSFDNPDARREPEEGKTEDVGTTLYMSPEQVNRQSYSNKVDVFALGVVFVEIFFEFGTEKERVDTLLALKKGILPEELRGQELIAPYTSKVGYLVREVCTIDQRRRLKCAELVKKWNKSPFQSTDPISRPRPPHSSSPTSPLHAPAPPLSRPGVRLRGTVSAPRLQQGHIFLERITFSNRFL